MDGRAQHWPLAAISAAVRRVRRLRVVKIRSGWWPPTPRVRRRSWSSHQRDELEVPADRYVLTVRRTSSTLSHRTSSNSTVNSKQDTINSGEDKGA